MGAEDKGGRSVERDEVCVGQPGGRRCHEKLLGQSCLWPTAEPCAEKLHFKIENVDKDPLHIHEEEARRGCTHDSNEKT